MKRILTIAFALTLVASSAFALDYGWSISGSSTDARVNTGDIAPGLPGSVYLWLTCTTVDGVSAMEARVDVQGLLFLSFTPMNGALNAGAGQELLLAVGGCPREDFLIGSISVLNLGTGGSLCLVPSTANGFNVTVDCDAVNPVTHENAVAGFATTGLTFCDTSDQCTVSVEDTSWGNIKGLYR
ncbi:MAG: hypothetical protein KC729_16120 [Candidatus Eisenbacteria bacterium]|uniref:Uncharacterized protein n=1 Tax=Eiseniibacteriota bacterium TaxID=2212470 RepID=A0A956M120_UNCEI|nr:hypothetical protein [Candidatus Eisenbacteria bacterium]